MKKHKKLKIIFLLVLVNFVVIAFNFYNNRFEYSQEYIPGTSNIKGNVDIDYFKEKGEEFEIGANRYGNAVFKNPSKAFKKLKKDYQKGIALIKKEYNLADLTKDNSNLYKTYRWQVETSDEESKKEAKFVTRFMDIYENSFKNK